MLRVLVSGSIAYDRIMDFPGLFAEHFMPEKLHAINLSFLVERLSVQYGGTAGNIAYNLALLGEQADIIATAGKDFGSYRSHLLLSGVEADSVRVDESDMTSSAYVLTDKADNQIAAFHPGAGGKAYDTPVATERSALAIIAPGCIADMKALPAHYRRQNLKFIYDPGQALTALNGEDLKDGINGASVLFGSDYEYELFKQKTSLSEAQILAQVPTIVVTYGAQGSDIVTKEGKQHVGACPAQALVDPTGAGDAFRAGFIKGMLLSAPYTTCAKIGSVAAVYVVEQYGTQTHRYTPEEFAHRFQKTYGEDIDLKVAPAVA